MIFTKLSFTLRLKITSFKLIMEDLMMDIKFEKKAQHEEDVINKVKDFLKKVPTIEKEHNMNVIIFQDGVNGSYYIKCSIQATNAAELCDLDARLDVCSTESYRANRELLLKHATFLKMQDDVSKGREFNDIIVEYNTDYNLEIPLKSGEVNIVLRQYRWEVFLKIDIMDSGYISL